MRVALRPDTAPRVTMFSDLLQQDREWNGLSVEQAARRVGVSVWEFFRVNEGLSRFRPESLLVKLFWVGNPQEFG